MKRLAPVASVPSHRALTAAAYQGLADVPPEIEWFANLGNAATCRAYQTALQDFMQFTGIARPEEFRTVTRAHVIAWRDELSHRALSATTIRHRLSALASLFDYLCDQNAVTHNPVKGVKRPVPETTEGKTPALGDHQARKLLAAPAGDTVKPKRDRAILATFLYHALRRDELCKPKVRDVRQERRGVAHLKVSGKGGKTRYLPLHPAASGMIAEYLEAAGHGGAEATALFRPLHNSRDPAATQSITLRVLSIFEVLLSTLFEVQFRFQFPHAVGESGKRKWEPSVRRQRRVEGWCAEHRRIRVGQRAGSPRDHVRSDPRRSGR